MKKIADTFELEPSPAVVGQVPDATLAELVRLKDAAKDAAKEYREAIEAQAKHHKVRKGALNRLVTAQAADKMHDLREETAALELLLRVA